MDEHAPQWDRPRSTGGSVQADVEEWRRRRHRSCRSRLAVAAAEPSAASITRLFSAPASIASVTCVDRASVDHRGPVADAFRRESSRSSAPARRVESARHLLPATRARGSSDVASFGASLAGRPQRAAPATTDPDCTVVGLGSVLPVRPRPHSPPTIHRQCWRHSPHPVLTRSPSPSVRRSPGRESTVVERLRRLTPGRGRASVSADIPLFEDRLVARPDAPRRRTRGAVRRAELSSTLDRRAGDGASS